MSLPALRSFFSPATSRTSHALSKNRPDDFFLRAAQFLGVERDFGTIEVGKVANPVLLDANPMEDIANTSKVRAVILRGRFLDRAALDRLLEESRSESLKTSAPSPNRPIL